MRILSHSETLLYYDGPQLIIANDQVGGSFICLLVDFDNNRDKFFCVQVSKRRLELFESGELDLRDIFESPETNEFFEGVSLNADLNNIQTEFMLLENIPQDWFPDSGFFMTERQEEVESVVIRETIERNRGIIYCSMNPPEALFESKISADHLSEGIWLFQRLYRQAYTQSFHTKKIEEKSIRDSLQSPENSNLETFGFSQGSFTIHLQTATQADMVGFSPISRAMDIIDSVNFEIEDIDHAVEIISSIGGHFATVYKDLLQFIIDNNIPFAYEWSMPATKKSVKAKINPREAKPLYEAIAKIVELGKEEKRLTGIFTKVDEQYGKWRLVSDSMEDKNKKYFGDSYINLGGIIVKTQRYEVICEEKLEIETINKKENKKLYLKSYRPL